MLLSLRLARVCCPKRTVLKASALSTSASQSSRSRSAAHQQQQLNVSSFPLRFAYQEFLPDPEGPRNATVERLVRRDMIRRRRNVELPEFYVGSIVAVTFADPQSPSPKKMSRFVGLVIQRGGSGVRSWFVVRNVIDHQGVEFMFEMYGPTIINVETLRLEKRLDDDLLYLRDAPLEYSTVPVDMDIEVLPEGSPVPINDIVVPLRPRPWHRRWDKNSDRYVGYSFSRDQLSVLEQNRWDKDRMYLQKGWQRETVKYDLMIQYRETIPIEEQMTIWNEVGNELIKRDKIIRQEAGKRAFQQKAQKAENAL